MRKTVAIMAGGGNDFSSPVSWHGGSAIVLWLGSNIPQRRKFVRVYSATAQSLPTQDAETPGDVRKRPSDLTAFAAGERLWMHLTRCRFTFRW
jgi:hypothetical protein